ncbi:MAG: agmatinase [Candidatus Kapaibacteriota bacterium]|jgi:agmatinase
MEVLGQDKNFLAIEPKYSSFENSAIVILPIPYEATTSYGKGTKRGPKAILQASAFVEFYDDETGKELCFEKGIATLAPLSFKKFDQDKSFSLIETTVENILSAGKYLVSLGGEHTIAYPIIKAYYRKYPNMSILQFDAHSDLRMSYEDNPYSHACVMARVIEFFPAENLVQIGIRALCREEASLIKEMNIKTFFASKIKKNEYGKDWVKKVVKSLNQQVYITFDVDFFDPSIMPSTGTPEPDGFLYTDAINIIREIIRSGRQIVGFDVVELAPNNKIHHPDLTTARLIYKMLNLIYYLQT